MANKADQSQPIYNWIFTSISTLILGLMVQIASISPRSCTFAIEIYPQKHFWFLIAKMGTKQVQRNIATSLIVFHT